MITQPMKLEQEIQALIDSIEVGAHKSGKFDSRRITDMLRSYAVMLGKHLAPRDATVSEEDVRMAARGRRVVDEIIESLRSSAVYVDEEGEDTDALEAFAIQVDRQRVGDTLNVPKEIVITDSMSPNQESYAEGFNACREAISQSCAEPKDNADYKALFISACASLADISRHLGLDPNDGGSEPIIDAIEVLLTQRARPGWLPIESAPRDGTHVLICEKWCNTPFVGFWNKYYSRWAADMDHIGSDGSAFSDICQPNVTHWMPLPSPPTHDDAEGSV